MIRGQLDVEQDILEKNVANKWYFCRLLKPTKKIVFRDWL